jgi:hypothetical protein
MERGRSALERLARELDMTVDELCRHLRADVSELEKAWIPLEDEEVKLREFRSLPRARCEPVLTVIEGYPHLVEFWVPCRKRSDSVAYITLDWLERIS